MQQQKHKDTSAQFYTDLQEECKAMLKYALRTGKSINSEYTTIIHQFTKQELTDDHHHLLMQSYRYLNDLIKPANPQTILLLEHRKQHHSSFLGPLPIVRQFMLLAIVSLALMILLSLSPHINNKTMILSMLQGQGISQILRLSFLVACASVGACFYALFKMNNYLSNGSFQSALGFTYWARYVLGIVAGLLLSELLATIIEPSKLKELDNTSYLLKPILAILGGFSANLVYRILNRLVETVESLFKGEMKDLLKQQKQVMKAESSAEHIKFKGEVALQLIQLRHQLAQTPPASDSLQYIDTLISYFLSQEVTPITLNHSIHSSNSNK